MNELVSVDNLPKRTLCIYMTRGEHKIRKSIDSMFEKFNYIIIDVDGERHKYDADSIISLLESLEVDDG